MLKSVEETTLLTKLEELVQLAKKKKNVLEYKEIMDHLADLDLDPDRIDRIYEYLESQNIDILGNIEAEEEVEKELHEAAKTAKTTPAGLSAKIEALLEEIKTLGAENEKLKSKLAKDSLGDVMNQVKEVNGVKVLASQVADVDMNGLRGLGDQLKDKLGEGVVVIASEQDGKVNLMATATDGAQKQGAHAGNLIKAIAGLVGGGGGGRPNMAQAGGKNPAGIEDALKKAVEVVQEQTK